MSEFLFQVGDRVRVTALPPYVKTADPMPMLRPPDTITIGEVGVVVDQRPGGFWGVRLTRGTFLLDHQYLETMPDAEIATPDHVIDIE